MIWFGLFMLGLGLVAFGLLRALRTRRPDQYMMGGGLLAALGFIGYDTWPAAILKGMERKEFLGIVLSIGAVVATLWAIHQLVWCFRAYTWPSAQGTVVRSGTALLDYRNDMARANVMSNRHAWRLSYTYTVNGHTYSNDQRSLDTDEEEMDLSAANALVRRHPAGSTITVYHHPKDPTLACIDRSAFNGRWLMPALFAAIMFGVATLL